MCGSESEVVVSLVHVLVVMMVVGVMYIQRGTKGPSIWDGLLETLCLSEAMWRCGGRMRDLQRRSLVGICIPYILLTPARTI